MTRYIKRYLKGSSDKYKFQLDFKDEILNFRLIPTNKYARDRKKNTRGKFSRHTYFGNDTTADNARIMVKANLLAAISSTKSKASLLD